MRTSVSNPGRPAFIRPPAAAPAAVRDELAGPGRGLDAARLTGVRERSPAGVAQLNAFDPGLRAADLLDGRAFILW
ncbi:hypothetical protein ACIA5C_46420 [Actinoplanes sp. NPDC051343]|uniref:hypothetical protein n=1 Tax=Actinoplanes sp. NPDC051343 TaxID=3363906 RepID=UPI0037A7ECFC